MMAIFSPLQLGHVIEELMKFQNPKYNIEADASVGSLCCADVFIKSTTFTNYRCVHNTSPVYVCMHTIGILHQGIIIALMHNTMSYFLQLWSYHLISTLYRC